MRYSPMTGMNTSRRSRTDTRQRQRQDDLAERRDRPGAQVARRLEERAVQALEADVDRQDHQRQVVVDDAQEIANGVLRSWMSPNPTQPRMRGMPFPPRSVHPGVGPDEEAGPERDDDEGDEHELPVAADLEREGVGHRVGDDRADDGVEGRVGPAVLSSGVIRVGRFGELLQRERGYVAAVLAADAERHDHEHDQRGDEERRGTRSRPARRAGRRSRADGVGRSPPPARRRHRPTTRP